MTNFTKGFLCLPIIFYCISLNAQKSVVQNLPLREPNYKRSALFVNSPQRLNLNVVNLESLLQSETGKEISITLAPDFTFRGIVSSMASKNENTVNSMIIRSTNWKGAAFSFTKINTSDSTGYFTGRIISFENRDGYELSFENGQYFLTKKDFYDMVNE